MGAFGSTEGTEEQVPLPGKTVWPQQLELALRQATSDLTKGLPSRAP